MFSLGHRIQAGSGTHPAYQMGIWNSSLGSKAAGTSYWPLTSIQWRGWEWVELHLHSPMSS